jgi:hypothetical protein
MCASAGERGRSPNASLKREPPPHAATAIASTAGGTLYSGADKNQKHTRVRAIFHFPFSIFH